MEEMYDSNGMSRTCPHGASVQYPIGTIKRIKVGDENCSQCYCYAGMVKRPDNIKGGIVNCKYPDFYPKNNTNP